jgi:hypothetical protein
MNPDEVNQFFAQIPPALICYVAAFFIGIFGLMLYFGVIKPARARRQLNNLTAAQSAAATATQSSEFSTAPAYPSTMAYAAAPSRASRPGEYRVKLSDGHMTEAREVLAVARDLEDDRLLVYVDGVGYRSMVESPEVKAKFTALMRELAETIAKADVPRPVAPVISPADLADDMLDELTDVDGYAGYEDDLDLPDVDLLTAPTMSEPSQMTPPPYTAPPAPAAPTSTRNTVSSVPPAADGTMPGALPSYRTENDNNISLKRQGIFRTPKVDLQPVPELNLAGAIEAYLQHKLNFTPEYVDRELHVHAAPGGGVRIQVDNRYYDAVSDIEDETVRTFIAETIQEWQERQ